MRTEFKGLLFVIALLLALFVASADAAVEKRIWGWRYFGSGTNDNDLLFTTDDISQFSECLLISTDGAVDVEVSIDGTNFTSAPLSLQDFGATSTAPVLLTAADRGYGWAGKWPYVRVRQNGATASAASLWCYTEGRKADF